MKSSDLPENPLSLPEKYSLVKSSGSFPLQPSRYTRNENHNICLKKNKAYFNRRPNFLISLPVIPGQAGIRCLQWKSRTIFITGRTLRHEKNSYTVDVPRRRDGFPPRTLPGF